MTDSPRRRQRIPKPGPIAQRKKLTETGTPVPATRLFQIFAESRILERVAKGELTETIMRSGTPSPDAGQPPGTVSLYVAYFDRLGTKVAEAHYYRLPDGSIGASHKIDPKIVVHKGILYYLDKP